MWVTPDLTASLSIRPEMCTPCCALRPKSSTFQTQFRNLAPGPHLGLNYPQQIHWHTRPLPA